MSMNLDDLFIDEEVGQSGIWVDFYSGSKLKLASTENAQYKAYLAKLARKHRLQLDQANDDSTGLIQEITAEAMAKHVLLDWRNVTLGGEQNAKYTPEKGKLALLNAPKLREFVSEQASDSSNFKKQLVEDVKKPSAGS